MSKQITMLVAAILTILGGLYGIKTIIQTKQENEAKAEMSAAVEKYNKTYKLMTKPPHLGN